MKRFIALIALLGCGNSPTTTPPIDNFDRAALRRQIAEQLVPQYPAFATAANAHAQAVGTYCSSGASDTALLGAARTTWQQAMVRWQRIEAVLVGPAARDSKTLRNRIYAWPLVAPCSIDRDTVSSFANPASYVVAEKLDNARSLAAVEYLLFSADEASQCAVTPAGWVELGANRAKARCQLAKAIADDVAVQAQGLAVEWTNQGGYQLTLAETLPEREAINMITDSFFYFEKMVRDMKLAEAAGIAINTCGTVGEPCVREVEARYADASTLFIRENVAALRDAYFGDIGGQPGIGFDDYLTAVGAGDLSQLLASQLDSAQRLANELPASYLDALANQRDKVVALHGAGKAITTELKSQFLTVLGLDVPDEVAADND